MKKTNLFKEFIQSEKAGGIILIFCTILSLFIANSAIGEKYLYFWNYHFAGLSMLHWVNDGLMTLFFLLVGIELKRELLEGELSEYKNALLPIIAAFGGMIIPAFFYMLINYGKTTIDGTGIPMATDIAFAIGVLSLLGKRVPLSLKIFLTALAVIDDLGAIITIAIFYTHSLNLAFLFLALSVFGLLLLMNKFKFNRLLPYLIGGGLMWFFMWKSGIHSTISGVLLAFTIPMRVDGKQKPSATLEHFLITPVAFVILPVFALANTCIIINHNWISNLSMPNSLGIFAGLIFGKTIGITLFSFIAVAMGFCALPNSIKWKHIIGVGFLGGIGFTMSIFITMLAFNNVEFIDSSKIAILLASLISGVIGLIWLAIAFKKNKSR